MSNIRLLKRLIVFVKPLIVYMCLAIVLGVLGFLASTFITILSAYMILDLLELRIGFVLLILFGILRGVFRYGEQASNHYIAFKLLAYLRDKIFFVLRQLSPAKLEGRDKGNLIAIITSDIELLEVFYAHTISPVAIAFIMTIIMVIFISSFHLILGFISFLAYISVGIILPIYISKRSKDYSRKFRSEYGKLSSFILESLRGIEEIIQFNKGKIRSKEITEKTIEITGIESKLKNITSQNIAISSAIIILYSLLILIVSSILYLNNIVEFKAVLIPTIAMFSSFGPVVALANLGSSLQQTFAAADRVFSILDESPVVNEIVGNKDIDAKDISLKNIKFSYDKKSTVLNNVDLYLPREKIIGVSGKSGSGKSTLIKMIMRFWKIDSGSIKFDNTDMDYINTLNLKKMQSYVTQDTVLFNTSIKNNIKIAKLDATDNEVINSAKKASIHEFIISLKDGYDTNIGELGDLLSSGEKQRIGIARAFLHNSNFIFLDEPTSNLDILNEAIVLKSINDFSKDKAVLLVSHRESTLSIADSIYKMYDGRVS